MITKFRLSFFKNFLIAGIFMFFLFPYPILATAPSFSLSSDSKNYSLGDTFPVYVYIDTSGYQVAGIGVDINFDPKLIKINSISKGQILNNYTQATFNNTQGTINISAIADSMDSQFTGTGLVATVSLTTLAPGTPELIINFSPGSTTDSNIAAIGEGDILNEVTNLTLLVKGPTPTGFTDNTNNLSHSDLAPTAQSIQPTIASLTLSPSISDSNYSTPQPLETHPIPTLSKLSRHLNAIEASFQPPFSIGIYLMIFILVTLIIYLIISFIKQCQLMNHTHPK